MDHVLFWVGVLSLAGTLIFPATAKYRRKAIGNWLFYVLCAWVSTLLIKNYFPSWEEPAWYSSTTAALISWMLPVVGLIIAIFFKKPRSHTLPEA